MEIIEVLMEPRYSIMDFLIRFGTFMAIFYLMKMGINDFKKEKKDKECKKQDQLIIENNRKNFKFIDYEEKSK